MTGALWRFRCRAERIYRKTRAIFAASTPGYWISKGAVDYTGSGGSDPTGSTTTPFEFSLDLSEFYNKHSDRMTVLYWAEMTND